VLSRTKAKSDLVAALIHQSIIKKAEWVDGKDLRWGGGFEGVLT
jgi:hypothetical protein